MLIISIYFVDLYQAGYVGGEGGEGGEGGDQLAVIIERCTSTFKYYLSLVNNNN